MAIRRKDFQKAAAFIHEFLLKLHEDAECAELRDSLNLALLHMQKYYRILQTRNHEKAIATTLSLTARGLSPMTPFVDAPDKFQYRWINLDSVRLMQSMGMDESMNLTVLPPIIQAAKQGNTELIVQLINSDPSCSDDQDGLGRSPLTYAVHFNQMATLQCLLENEANPNISAHDGSTAIHQACHDSNTMALGMLLQYGGDFTIPDTMGRAPIHWAVTTHSTDCLHLLIQHHADVNVRDKDGLSPSMWACRLDHIQHFELLSRAENFRVDDADGIERDLIGRTWMHWAVRRMEPLECLQTLLTNETAAIKDDEGRTVLLTAAEMGSLPACKIILEIAGHKFIMDRDNQSRNALHLAAIGGHGDVVNFLLDNKADLPAVDKFNATPWDYAKNRQLHYCMLIIMSHQRQRLVSNPTSPIPNGLGLILNGDFGASMDFDYMSTRGSVDSQPITPPHPPKRPRTSRNVRRSHSLGSDRDRIGSVASSLDRERYNFSREQSMSNYSSREDTMTMGNFSREQTMTMSNFSREPTISRDTTFTREPTMTRDAMFTREPSMDRRPINSADDMTLRGNERIEVSVNTRTTALEGYSGNEREEVAMATDDHIDEDVDEVVGGMDVSDIEDEDDRIPRQARGPPRRVPPDHGPGPPLYRPVGAKGPVSRPSRPPGPPPGPQPNFQPAPPARYHYQPRPPAPIYTQSMQQSHRRSSDFVDETPTTDLQSKPPVRSPNPPPGQQRPGTNYFNRTPSPNPAESFPPPSRPRPAPRPPRMQPSPPKPQQGRTPSPVNRPGSGPSVRDTLTSPPMVDQAGKDMTRPDSGNRPPGIEGKKILPPPMLMPLENAPKPPSLHSKDRTGRRKKKKKRDRAAVDKDEREIEAKSPPQLPENLTPPRGYAAPLHPPPSATVRQQRAQSGIPSPKYSKGAPHKHEPQRYTEESMDDKEDDIGGHDGKLSEAKPPIINGMAVPIREGPRRSAKPGGKRTQEMDSDNYEVNDIGISNGDIQANDINEDEEVGPLIPPPQGFRGPSTRPLQGRPLSQSVPQDSKSNAVRMSSASKPPLPRGRGSASGSTRYRNPSPPRRPQRPTTGRTDPQ